MNIVDEGEHPLTVATDTSRTEAAIPVRKDTLPRFFVPVMIAIILLGSGVGVFLIQERRARALIPAETAVSVTDVDRVSCIASGTVKQVLVRPGQGVKSGQLVAILENPALVAQYRQAQKDLVEATKEDAATAAKILPPPITGALRLGPPPDFSKLKPLPAIGPATRVLPESPRISPPPVSHADVVNRSKADAAQAELKTDQALLAKATDDYNTSQSELEEAQSVYQSTLLPIDSLKSALDVAKTKRDKFQGLYNDGIISRAEFQQKQNDLDNAQSSLDQANQNSAAAQDNVKAKQAIIDSISKSIVAAQAKLAKDQVTLTKIRTTSPSPVVSNTEQKLPETQFTPPPFPTFTRHHKGRLSMPSFAPPPNAFAPAQVAFSPDKHVEAETKVQKAQRVIHEIEQKIKGLRVVANTEGTVVKINYQPGEAISDKSVLLILLRPATQRIVATFPHRDAIRISPGLNCDVEFSEFPGRTFKGQVARFLSAGSLTEPAKVEILIPDRISTLSTLMPGTETKVRVHPT